MNSDSPRPLASYGRQLIGSDDIAAVAAVLQSDRLTEGAAVTAFEAALSRRVGAADTVVCANGTAALHLANLALDYAANDAAIVPAITFAATANAVRLSGGQVVFADVDPSTALMQPAHVAKAMDEAMRRGLHVKAICPVHMAGQAEPLSEIAAMAREAGAVLIEDACHAIGTEITEPSGLQRVGDCAHSLMTVFSFHPVKTITSAEGGAITTQDAKLADRLRRLRGHGITRDPGRFVHPDQAFGRDGRARPWYYEMQELGLNYRLTDIQAALGASQLGKLDWFLERRRALVAEYDRLLAPLAPVIDPPGRVAGCNPGWHLYMARVDFEACSTTREDVMNALRDCGIGTQVHYIPVPWLPYWRQNSPAKDYPGAAEHYRRCLSLPLHPGMQEADVAAVVDALATILGKTRG